MRSQARLGEHEHRVDAAAIGQRDGTQQQARRDEGKARPFPLGEIRTVDMHRRMLLAAAPTVIPVHRQPGDLRDPAARKPCRIDDRPIQRRGAGNLEG